MYYYKVFDLNDKMLGVCSSLDLYYYSEKTNRFVHEFESLAQYVCVNDSFYRVEAMNDENLSQRGKYPIAYMNIITQDEYEKLKPRL